MSALRISLFGRFEAYFGDTPIDTLNARRVQELLCYLLIHRMRTHPREAIADLLWPEYPAERAKKCLRQTLWQLKSTLDPFTRALLIDDEWIGINPDTGFDLDVARLEEAYQRVKYVDGDQISPECAHVLRSAADEYRGDLLEGWYQDWCLVERNRLQQMYFAMLDKLVDYCEARREFVSGIVYADRLLTIDPAHERTHQRLMNLHYQSGDRTAALRQFQRCEDALRVELAIQPGRHTIALRDLIKADALNTANPHEAPPREPRESKEAPREVTSNLRELQSILNRVQSQIQQMLHAEDPTNGKRVG